LGKCVPGKSILVVTAESWGAIGKLRANKKSKAALAVRRLHTGMVRREIRVGESISEPMNFFVKGVRR
jgi:hypothetical protein